MGNIMQDGAPQICERWFINHEITPMNTIYIYIVISTILATYLATERYRLGAPSCGDYPSKSIKCRENMGFVLGISRNILGDHVTTRAQWV